MTSRQFLLNNLIRSLIRSLLRPLILWLQFGPIGRYILKIFLALLAFTSLGPVLTSNSWAQDNKVSVGTGFIVSEGYLLTANHTLRDKDSIWVGPVDGKKWVKASVIKTDNALDLALISAQIDAKPLTFANWSQVPTGLEISVIGFPQPRLQGISKKITVGIINGNRSDRNDTFDQGYFQFSAEVSRGNSGGPVLSPDGLVVGMVQKKLDVVNVVELTQDLPINVNYGLKSSQLIDFLKDSPAKYSTKSISLQNPLRPYQIYAQTEGSVWTVVGRKMSAAELESEAAKLKSDSKPADAASKGW